MSFATDAIASLREVNPQSVELAEAVSLAIRIEPELLREARLHLVNKRADASAESDLWFSNLVQKRSPLGIVLRYEIVDELRAALALNKRRLDAARRLIVKMHQYLSPALKLEEDIIYYALAGNRAAVRDALRSALVTLVAPDRASLADWAVQAYDRLPLAIRESEEATNLALAAALRTGENPSLSSVGSARLADSSWITSLLGATHRRCQLWMRFIPGALEFSRKPLPSAHVIEVGDSPAVVVNVTWNEKGEHHSHKVTLPPDSTALVQLNAAHAELQTVTGERLLITRQGVAALSVLQDGRLAFGGVDGKITLWDLAARKRSGTLDYDSQGITLLTSMADSRLVSIDWRGKITLWDLVQGEAMGTLDGPSCGIGAVAEANASQLISGDWDGEITLWDISRRDCLATLTAHTAGVTSFALLPDDGFASASWDGKIILWNLGRREPVATLSAHFSGVTSLAVLPDGRLASASWDGKITLWDLGRREPIATLSAHSSGVTSLAVLPDGRLASGSWDGQIVLWDLTRPDSFVTLDGNTAGITALGVLPEGGLASRTSDGRIRIWDTASKRCIAMVDPQTGQTNLQYKKNGKAIWCTPADWDLKALAINVEGKSSVFADVPFAAQLVHGNRWKIEQVISLEPGSDQNEAQAVDVTLDIEDRPLESYVVMVRHLSNATRFHFPTESPTDERTGKTTRRFTIPVPSLMSDEEARLPKARAINIAILKLVGKTINASIAEHAYAWEAALWKTKGRHEGFVSVGSSALHGSHRLPSIDLSKAKALKRSLLFIHGGLSDTQSTFAELGRAFPPVNLTIFQILRELYEDRIYGFDHFTISRTPEDNARMLLESLPQRTTTFDVVTHGRGGLVLRHLVERSDLFPGLSERFALGRACLIASPNEGVPLSSHKHLTDYINWLANILQCFPDNPLNMGAEFVSEALAVISRRIPGELPGLAGTDSDSPSIRGLNDTSGPPPKAYSVLIANYEADKVLLKRFKDAGIDWISSTPNDLATPTDGGSHIGSRGSPTISKELVGFFGRGGNLIQQRPVHHFNFFQEPSTIEFVIRFLKGNLNITTKLKVEHRNKQLPSTSDSSEERGGTALESPSVQNQEEWFSIVLENPKWKESTVDLTATFRNARVTEKVCFLSPKISKHWKTVRAVQDHIWRYINGDPKVPTLPAGTELERFGAELFLSLMPGQVRRLYDVARNDLASQRLNIIFISDIGLVGDQAWEFCYDPMRFEYLALKDVNFIRSISPLPSDLLPQKAGLLRILVVVAQPLGIGKFSIEEQKDVIRSGFRRLLDAGLAEVEILLDATPELLHRTLASAAVPIDVLHFIGYGEYNEENDSGYVIFENLDGGEQRLDSSTLSQVVCRRGIRLVCLNTCETGRGGRQDFSRGVVKALIEGGVPAVVANRYPILEVSASHFYRHFYWALAIGQPICDAAREARVSVNYSISGEAIDWAVPVLFARNPVQRFCVPRTAAKYEQTRQAAVRQRRRAVEGRIRIGIWNAHRMIPHLPEICDRLTKAQDRYAFETVSFPAPIGIWRREQEKDRAFVVADILYERLKYKPKELGMDSLICMVNFPMKDARTRYLFYWLRDPLIVTSTFGLLEQLNEREFTVERMMAHLAAAVVAGIPPHPRRVGPADCPFFYNEVRDIRSIAGRLTICTSCRKQFKNRDGKDRLQATERILAAYS